MANRKKNLIKDNAHSINKDETFQETLDKHLTDTKAKLIAEHCLIETKKGYFAKKVVELLEQGEPVPDSLAALITEINTIFS